VPLLSSHLRPKSNILIIGSGEGRDALFLARLGFKVVATEISESGLNRLRGFMKQSELDIQAIHLDAHEPHDHLGKFNAILMMNVVQFLDPARMPDVIEHMQSLVLPGGYMSVQVFTVEDPEYQKLLKESIVKPGQLTVDHPRRGYPVRFFEKNELSSYFNGWEFIHYHEGLIWDKPHGSSQSDFHQHGLAQLIARKKLSDSVI